MLEDMSSRDFVTQILLGNNPDFHGGNLEGDFTIVGNSGNNKLQVESVDLENMDIYGNVRIQNVHFNGDLNFYHACVNGKGNGTVTEFVLEDVIIDGDLSLPQNLAEMVKDGQRVFIHNVHVKGQIQFCSP